ncbi:MAG: CDP-alcohol phosphatidyltransferase family protein [Patescibacteria group bacterium]
MRWSELLNLPNILSLSRPIILLPLIALVLLWFNWIFIGAILYILGVVTDYLDGRLARKNGNVTVTGKLLDPMADKLFFDLMPFFFYHRLSDFLQYLFVAAYLPLECLLFLGGLYAWFSPSQNIFPVGANQGGKWKTASIVIFTILLFVNKLVMPVSEEYLTAILGSATGFALMSFVKHINMEKLKKVI